VDLIDLAQDSDMWRGAYTVLMGENRSKENTGKT